jgi:hypothetical protein
MKKVEGAAWIVGVCIVTKAPRERGTPYPEAGVA